MRDYDVIIIGGGPAGLAAAIAAKEEGCGSILILERDKRLGGILSQCIHNGFGLHTFREELTGPEYAARYIEKARQMDIEYKLNTMVIDINPQKQVTAMNKEDGLITYQAKAVVLAMGCRERPRGALNIPGYRPSGIFTAGTAQYFVNMEGLMPGREVVILGSGDIGLIMARRMTLEGAAVKMVVELMPYSGGLKRNIVQCLDDYGIPLKLSHTIVDIDGKDRLKGVTVARVDENRKPIQGTEEYVKCDTLLLSVGLIPENELSRGAGILMDAVTSGPVVNESLETSLEGVFACGNVLHVHDLVDYVSGEAVLAGRNAARYVRKETIKESIKEAGKEAIKETRKEARKGVRKETVEETIKGAKKETIKEIIKGTGKNIVTDTINETAKETVTDIIYEKNLRKMPPVAVAAARGVRYTIPQFINPEDMDETLTVRFRVDNVYKNGSICVLFDDREVFRRKKRILSPGEMEEIKLKKEDLCTNKDLKKIIIKIEK